MAFIFSLLVACNTDERHGVSGRRECEKHARLTGANDIDRIYTSRLLVALIVHNQYLEKLWSDALSARRRMRPTYRLLTF